MLRLLIAISLLFVTACGPEGTWTRHGASNPKAHVYMAPAPQALAKSVNWWVIREYGAPPAHLPVAVAPSMEAAVPKLQELVPHATIVPMDDPNAIRIESLRLSRNKASVDLSAPRKGLPRQLLTIDLHRYNGPPWIVTGANWWRFNEKQLREVHDQVADHQAAAAEAAAEAAAAEAAAETPPAEAPEADDDA